MILLSGIHGVGKSFFCKMLKETLGVESYTASELISSLKKDSFKSDKRISDIQDNQRLLLSALNERAQFNNHYILDGHLCLLDSQGNVEKIKEEVFRLMNPEAIILLTEEPGIIAERRLRRDGIADDLSHIEEFQKAEIEYARLLSAVLTIPVYVCEGYKNFPHAIEFVETFAKNHGWIMMSE